jgi:hypothetical protein
MKRILILIVIGTFLFSEYSAKSQVAVYDAQYLSKIDVSMIDKMLGLTPDTFPTVTITRIDFLALTDLEKQELKNLKIFLTKPFSKDVKPFNYEVIQKIFEQNKLYFLILNDMTENVSNFSGGVLGSLNVISSVFSGNSSFSDSVQSNIIDGLAKYYAEEFRKAQTITYMKAFVATAGKIGELQILFPETLQKLKNADPSRFPDLGNEYKEIFSKDLKNAWSNLNDYIDTSSVRLPDSKLTLLKDANLSVIRNHEFYFPAMFTSAILDRLIKGQHPVEILNFLDGRYYDPAFVDKLNGKRTVEESVSIAIHGLNLFQANLRDTSQVSGRIWVGQEVMRGLNTEKELRYFVGLIYQQDRAYFDQLFGGSFEDYVADLNKLKSFMKKYINPIIDELDRIQTLKMAMAQAEDKSQLFLDYMESHIRLVKGVKILNEDLSPYFALADDLIDFHNSIRESDFSNAIYHVLKIASRMLEGSDIDLTSAIFKMEEYGGFMSEIVNAENSDEIKETIKKFAAPPASFILKRTYKHTISITGQPGYFVSFEQLEGQRDWKIVSGITLPMGFDYSFKPKSDPQNTRASVSVFVQLLDLGAVLNFRLDDATSDLPEMVEFDQVFSPGISFNYGFKNSPMTLGLGYQRSPELRELNIEGSDSSFPKGHRVFVRMGWDIPFINIFKSKGR